LLETGADPPRLSGRYLGFIAKGFRKIKEPVLIHNRASQKHEKIKTAHKTTSSLLVLS
jgi:hypothetical protein